MTPLRAAQLSYRYPGSDESALHGVSLELPAAQASWLLGPNQVGKSTLLLALAGFLPHSLGGELRGTITLGDLSLPATPLSTWVRHVGMVFAEPETQLSHIKDTVFEEVAFGLENLGVPPRDIEMRVPHILERLGLSELAERHPLTLSGGETQRLAIANILVQDPTVLCLDEATSHLDARGTRDVLGILDDLRAQGNCVLMASHPAPGLEHTFSHGLTLDVGNLVYEGDVEGAVARYRHCFSGAEPVPLELPPVDPVTVRLEQLCYHYSQGRKVLRDVTLELNPGQITALVGDNGAGKSTLARMLNGLLRPSRGCVLLNQKDIQATPVATLARSVGYLFQHPSEQLFAPSAWREVTFGPKNLGFDEAHLKRAAELALELCGLTPYAERHPFDLSPSERRWLALASVLAMETSVLVLDEPSAGFDLREKRRLQALLQALRAHGRTVLIITHDEDLVRLADQVCVMHAGNVTL